MSFNYLNFGLHEDRSVLIKLSRYCIINHITHVHIIPIVSHFRINARHEKIDLKANSAAFFFMFEYYYYSIVFMHAVQHWQKCTLQGSGGDRSVQNCIICGRIHSTCICRGDLTLRHYKRPCKIILDYYIYTCIYTYMHVHRS